MKTTFTGSEVMDLAVKLEKRAIAFYRWAAQNAHDPAGRQLFSQLADMEADHQQVFAALRDAAARPAATDWNTTRWVSVANILLAQVQDDLSQRFRGKYTWSDILREALAFEKDTIVFLETMRQMIPPGEDHRPLEGIIREELGHLLLLGTQLAAAATPPAAGADAVAGQFGST
jgi:rubrerythrin